MAKIIANYLPQYHETKENNMWWGKGYTDWFAVKKAKSLYEGHMQPRVPLEGYYDLSDVNTIRWQAKLAKEHGVYGFGIYHYWFSSKQCLLTKPAELLLENKDIDINFMFIWDNGSWKRSWSNISFSNDWAPMFENEKENQSGSTEKNGLLAELIYGESDEWKKHFEYLLPYFKDERYIKIDNRPVFAFFHQDNETEKLKSMIEYWDDIAKNFGFDGVCIIGQTNTNHISFTEYEFNYQPTHSGWPKMNLKELVYYKLTGERLYYRHNYDAIWEKIISEAEKNKKSKILSGAFVSYDDSPRRGEKGMIVEQGSPEKFEKYMTQLLKICEDQPFIFLTAWNEWGEGAYMEPDEDNKYGYLDALRNAVEGKNNEL